MNALKEWLELLYYHARHTQEWEEFKRFVAERLARRRKPPVAEDHHNDHQAPDHPAQP